jgi:hypothetical protein
MLVLVLLLVSPIGYADLLDQAIKLEHEAMKLGSSQFHSLEEATTVFEAIKFNCRTALRSANWKPAHLASVRRVYSTRAALTILIDNMERSIAETEVKTTVKEYLLQMQEYENRLSDSGKLTTAQLYTLNKCIQKMELYLNPVPKPKILDPFEEMYAVVTSIEMSPTTRVAFSDLNRDSQEALATYAHMGHEFNLIVATQKDSMINVETPSGSSIMRLSEFASQVQGALAALPSYTGGGTLRRAATQFPFGAQKLIEIDDEFLVLTFLSTTKNLIRDYQFEITPLATDSCFRDISENRYDNTMGEVLGMIGCRLKYVGEVSGVHQLVET